MLQSLSQRKQTIAVTLASWTTFNQSLHLYQLNQWFLLGYGVGNGQGYSGFCVMLAQFHSRYRVWQRADGQSAGHRHSVSVGCIACLPEASDQLPTLIISSECEVSCVEGNRFDRSIFEC